MPYEARSWEARIEAEELVDVGEWAEVRGQMSPFPWPTAITRALWDLMVPGQATGQGEPARRIERLLDAAERALDRALAGERDRAARVSLQFAAPVSAVVSLDRARWQRMRIVGGPDASGAMRLVIGLAEELGDSRPLSVPRR